MANILMDSEIAVLDRAGNLKEKTNGQFLTSGANPNYRYINKKFFDGDTTKSQILTVGSGLYQTVSNTISAYVGNPVMQDIEIDLSDYVKDFVSIGYCTIGLRYMNNQWEFYYLPAENYLNTNGEHKVVRIYQKTTDQDNELYYALVSNFKSGTIENTLYQMEDEGSFDEGTPVALNTIPQTEGMQEIEQTGLNIPAILVIKDTGDSTIQYPTSVFEKIRQLVDSIDRNMTMFESQFLQDIKQFILVKGIQIPDYAIDESGRVDFDSLGKIIQTTEDGAIEFIKNENNLIGKAIEYNNTKIQNVSAITSIPVEFLGINTNDGAIGQGSRTLKHGYFIKYIEGLRYKFQKELHKGLEAMGLDESITWGEIFAKTDLELVEELEKVMPLGILSKETALSLYLGYKGEEITNELNLVNGNQRNQNAPNTETPEENN